MITWTYSDSGQAYISLTDKLERGIVEESVDVGDLVAEADDREWKPPSGIHFVVLDFDREGRLVGIEIPAKAEQVLPRDLLAERGYQEEKYRREL